MALNENLEFWEQGDGVHRERESARASMRIKRKKGKEAKTEEEKKSYLTSMPRFGSFSCSDTNFVCKGHPFPRQGYST